MELVSVGYWKVTCSNQDPIWTTGCMHTVVMRYAYSSLCTGTSISDFRLNDEGDHDFVFFLNYFEIHIRIW